jgi:hypothetical protein
MIFPLLLLLLPVSGWALTTVDCDVLYWKADENELDSLIQDDNIEHPDFRHTFGFRIGIEQTLRHDAWDLNLDWTHFHTHTESSYEGVLSPTWSVSSPSVNNANTHWRLHLGLVDLDLGKWLSTSSRLFIRPYMGIRYAIVRQKYFLDYGTSTIHMKNKFAGIGPILGARLQWLLISQLYLFGNGSLSLPYGEVYIHQAEWENEKDRLRMHDCSHQVLPMTDWSAGLGWEWACKRMALALELGWEELFFFGQNQLKNFSNPSLPGKFLSNFGDLSVTGWTLSTHITF